MGIEVYVFAVFVLIILGCVYAFHLKEKYQKAVIGHQYSTFQTFTNSRIDALCRVDGKIVIPPKGLLSDVPKSTDYIVPDKTFNCSYPPHFPSFVQATVPSAVYNEGNPDALGQSHEAVKMSPALMHNLRNEASTALIMRGATESLRGEDIMRALETAGGGNKTVMYICFGIIAIVGILGFFVFQLSGQIGDLLALYGM